MKYYICFVLALVVLGCNSKPENGNGAATTSTPSVATTPQAAAVSADCKRVGTSLDKFEQNNAVFERFKNTQTTQEWLKITTKDGGCKIIDSLANANHDSVQFEDWDKDGFKDRINASKWYYEVALFNAQTNDFSRPIEGVFSGDQSDYDKARGLKWQFMEDKSGGTYELYKISDLKKMVYCQIHVNEDEDGKRSIEVVNKKGTTDASSEGTVIKTDPSLLNAKEASLITAIQAYWRKNEAVFVPK